MTIKIRMGRVAREHESAELTIEVPLASRTSIDILRILRHIDPVPPSLAA